MVWTTLSSFWSLGNTIIILMQSGYCSENSTISGPRNVVWNFVDFLNNHTQKAWVGHRPRNPRFKDVHTGMKRRLVDKKSNRDSGISGSGWATLSSFWCNLLIVQKTRQSMDHVTWSETLSIFWTITLKRLGQHYQWLGRTSNVHSRKRRLPESCRITIVDKFNHNQSKDRFQKLHKVCAGAFLKCLADIRPSWTDYD
jgi:hypothetical protein